MKRLLVVLIVVAFATTSIAAEADYLKIPSSVVWIYVFIQNPDSTAKGSGKEIATMITPKQFRDSFNRYRDIAKRENAKLIVTAETEGGQWIQNQITYKGESLKIMPYYNPGIGKAVPGAEVPLN